MNEIEEPEQVLRQGPSTVAILARDVVAGQALEILLQNAGYSTRFVIETVSEGLAEALDGVQLLLLGPTLQAGRREDYLHGMRGTPETAKIPVLELITTPDGDGAEREGYVPWPCRIEDLKGKIEAALLGGSS